MVASRMVPCVMQFGSILARPCSYLQLRRVFSAVDIISAGQISTQAQHREFTSKSSPGIYTPAKKGVEVPFVVKPDLDLASRFGSCLSDLKKSINARKVDADLTEMIRLWQGVQELEEKKRLLEVARKENRTKAKALSQNKISDAKEVRNQREEGKQLREQLKNVNSELNSILDKLYPLALSLPNQIHHDVALGKDNRVVGANETGATGMKTSLSDKRDQSIFTDPLEQLRGSSMKADAPHIQQKILQAAEETLTEEGFTQLSCPDMIKPYALDALGQNYVDRGETFFVVTNESDMCLTGLSPISLYAYYMMSVIEGRDLPERCFSVGCSYNAQYVSNVNQDLTQHFQGHQVQFLCLFENCYQEEDAFFSSLLNNLQEFYTNIGVSFRVVQTASENLLPAVYRRYAIEVLSPSKQTFLEVAHLSSCCDFVSRRLMIKYPENREQSAVESRQRRYPFSIHGTLVDCNILLDHLSIK